MQTAGMIKSAGRKEQKDNKGDERKDNGEKNNKEEGGKKKEKSNSRLLEIMKGRRMREEHRLKTSAKWSREKKRSKRERKC